MKKALLIILGLSVFALNGFAKPVLINRVVAKVNNSVITQTQLDDRMAIVKKNILNSKMKLPSHAVLKDQVLQQMIDEKIQLEYAEKTGIRASESDVNEAISKIAKGNNTDMKGVYASAQKEGWTIEDFRNNLKQEVILHKLQGRDVASHISISQGEVDDFIRNYLGNNVGMPEYHLGDILLALPETPTPDQIDQVKKSAENIMTQLKQGADFHQLALAKSKGSEALQGGDLGWRKLAELPDVFAQAVVNMKEGSVAGPFQTPNGFHLIKLLGVKLGTVKKDDEESELQMIFLKKTSGKNDQLLEQKLLNYRDKIQSGENFSAVAKSYSEGDHARRGGYMGWVNPSQLSLALASAANNLSPGEISQPISTNEGYYLIKVLAKRRMAKSTDAQKQEVEQMIFQRKLSEDLMTYVSQLRSQSYVRIED